MPRGMKSTTRRKIAPMMISLTEPLNLRLGVHPERQRLDDQRAEHRAADRA